MRLQVSALLFVVFCCYIASAGKGRRRFNKTRSAVEDTANTWTSGGQTGKETVGGSVSLGTDVVQDTIKSGENVAKAAEESAKELASGIGSSGTGASVIGASGIGASGIGAKGIGTGGIENVEDLVGDVSKITDMGIEGSAETTDTVVSPVKEVAEVFVDPVGSILGTLLGGAEATGVDGPLGGIQELVEGVEALLSGGAVNDDPANPNATEGNALQEFMTGFVDGLTGNVGVQAPVGSGQIGSQGDSNSTTENVPQTGLGEIIANVLDAVVGGGQDSVSGGSDGGLLDLLSSLVLGESIFNVGAPESGILAEGEDGDEGLFQVYPLTSGSSIVVPGGPVASKVGGSKSGGKVPISGNVISSGTEDAAASEDATSGTEGASASVSWDGDASTVKGSSSGNEKSGSAASGGRTEVSTEEESEEVEVVKAGTTSGNEKSGGATSGGRTEVSSEEESEEVEVVNAGTASGNQKSGGASSGDWTEVSSEEESEEVEVVKAGTASGNEKSGGATSGGWTEVSTEEESEEVEVVSAGTASGNQKSGGASSGGRTEVSSEEESEEVEVVKADTTSGKKTVVKTEEVEVVEETEEVVESEEEK